MLSTLFSLQLNPRLSICGFVSPQNGRASKRHSRQCPDLVANVGNTRMRNFVRHSQWTYRSPSGRSARMNHAFLNLLDDLREVFGKQISAELDRLADNFGAGDDP